MVITDKFVWIHFPKCAGTELQAVLKAMDIPNSKHDPLDYNNVIWHHTIKQRQAYDSTFSVEGKEILCCIRRLPTWILSRVFYEYGRTKRYPHRGDLLQGKYCEQFGKLNSADTALSLYTAEVTRWIRTEFLCDDFVNALSDLISISKESVGPLFEKRHTREYLKDPAFYFTQKEIDAMYDYNPVWKSIEEKLYGGLMVLPKRPSPKPPVIERKSMDQKETAMKDASMPIPTWLDDNKCKIGNLTFDLTCSDFTRKTTAESVVVLKPKFFLEDYQSRFRDLRSPNILELGIFQGGTPLFLAAALPNINRIATVDICKPVEPFLQIIKDSGFEDKIFPFFTTSQDNASVLTSIFEGTLDHRVDVIIDDASHRYKETKATFEIMFPLLANGGLYIIEDWGWAHWKNGKWQNRDDKWINDPAMSNLIFELAMLCATMPSFVKKIEVFPSYIVLTKGPSVIPVNFSISNFYQLRNKEFRLL